MEKFELVGKVTISVYTEVKANTSKEAIKIAEEREIEQGDWGGNIKEYAWISDRFDGEVQDVAITKVS